MKVVLQLTLLSFDEEDYDDDDELYIYAQWQRYKMKKIYGTIKLLVELYTFNFIFI